MGLLRNTFVHVRGRPTTGTQLDGRGFHLDSAERESECLHTGIEKFDLEVPVDDWFRLSDQRIQALLDYAAVTGTGS